MIQLGPDPLYQRVPVRNFRADVSLAGEIADTLTGLADAMRPLLAKHRESRDLRRARVTDAARSLRKTIRSKAAAGNAGVADEGLGEPLPVGGDRRPQRDGAVGTRLPA